MLPPSPAPLLTVSLLLSALLPLPRAAPRHLLAPPPTFPRRLCFSLSHAHIPKHTHTHTHTRGHTGFHDVAHEGALFSPTRKGAYFDSDSIEEDIEDELLVKKGAVVSLAPLHPPTHTHTHTHTRCLARAAWH